MPSLKLSRTLPLSLFFLFLFLSSAEAVWNGGLASSFAGGDGLTSFTAYEIATPEQLAYMADLVSNENAAYGGKFYRLTADIDLGGVEWMPIGGEGTSFAGHFDGGAHTIRNLRIDRPDENSIGLFGSAGAAVFKDIFIESADVVGRGWVGGLVGYLGPDGRATNCSASGRVRGTGDCVGGLVGESQGEISDSYAACRVEGVYNVGGFAGLNVGAIAYCHAEGDVAATGDYVGGLAGLLFGDVEDSWALGDVKGVNYVGGLVGCVDKGRVEGSFATGSAAGRESVGGLIGLHNGTAANVYAFGNATGTDYVGGLVGYNTGGVVVNSFAVGNAAGAECVGGLVGGNGGCVEKAYVVGSAAGTNYVGGAVGSNWGDVSRVVCDGSARGEDCVGGLIGRHALAALSKSESHGFVEGTGRVGALVGHFYSGSVEACRWLSAVTSLEAFGEKEEGTERRNTGSYTELGPVE